MPIGRGHIALCNNSSILSFHHPIDSQCSGCLGSNGSSSALLGNHNNSFLSAGTTHNHRLSCNTQHSSRRKPDFRHHHHEFRKHQLRCNTSLQIEWHRIPAIIPGIQQRHLYHSSRIKPDSRVAQSGQEVTVSQPRTHNRISPRINDQKQKVSTN